MMHVSATHLSDSLPHLSSQLKASGVTEYQTGIISTWQLQENHYVQEWLL